MNKEKKFIREIECYEVVEINGKGDETIYSRCLNEKEAKKDLGEIQSGTK